MKKSIFLIFAAILCATSAWADVNWKGGNFYFDNSLGVNKGYVMLCGRRHKENGSDNWYTAVTTFGTKVIEGTNLYYTGSLEGSTWSTSTWNGWTIISDKNKWNNNNFDNWTGAGWCSEYRNNIGFSAGKSYVLIPTSTSKSKTINVDEHSSFEGINHTQQVYRYTSIDDGASFSAQNMNSGDVTISAYAISGDGVSSQESKTIDVAATTEVSVKAAYTGKVQLTASAHAGFAFVGWFDVASGGTALSTENTYTYNASNSDRTIYARFSENTFTVTFANDGNGTTNKTGAIEVGVVTGIEINATPNTDFEFNVWESSNGGTFATTAADANNTFYPTANTTLTATFRSTAVNALLVVAGENITSVTGSTDPVTLGNSYPITATPADGYEFDTWTAEPAANATFDDATSANTNVTVQNGSVTVTASAAEIMSTLTTANTYDVGTPSITNPTATASEIGIATTATVTAETHADYALASWTLENCVRTDAGADNATTITVKSNGDGAAATVTANYNIIPKITLYFVNSLNWTTVKCHHWKDGGSTTTWPGDPMEVVGTVRGFDIYKVKFTELEHNLCIFNNDDKGEKTGNLAVQDGKYYYPETDEWYATVAEIPTPCTDCSDYAIAGSMNDWSARRNRLKETANNDIVELTLELTAGDYEFKVAGPEGWFGNSGKYEREHSGNAWTFRLKKEDKPEEDEANARMYADVTGEYVFTWNISDKKLTITYPELPDLTQQISTIFFRPSDDWKQANARFAAYFFGASEEKWVDMTDADGDGVYEAANDKTNLSVKICRMDPAKLENNWDNDWNSSANFEIPTGVENCWFLENGQWDGATGLWVAYDETNKKFLDEKDNSYFDGKSANIFVNRQFTTGNLYTIALPFALNNVAEIFGEGTVVYEYAELAQEGADVVLYFKKVNALESGKPYLIEPTQDVPGFTVEGVTVSDEEKSISFTSDQTTISMNAILTTSGTESTNGTTQYWLDAERWLRNGTTQILGLRALFNMTTTSGMPPRARVSLGENGTTGIEDIITTDAPVKVIENGQLIIIRAGEKFNVQGQKM